MLEVAIIITPPRHATFFSIIYANFTKKTRVVPFDLRNCGEAS
jgi:hypothetical protein